MKKKGEISTSTMIYIGLGLLVLILGAIMVGRMYSTSQNTNSGCGLVDKSAECQEDSCPAGTGSIGYCGDNPKGKFCCKQPTS